MSAIPPVHVARCTRPHDAIRTNPCAPSAPLHAIIYSRCRRRERACTGSRPSHCPPRRPPLTRSASLGVSGSACISPPFLDTANPRAHGPSLEGECSNEHGPTKTDASISASRTTPTPPRDDVYVAAGVGIANGSHAARMRTGAIKAEEKDEWGGYYGSTTTARSRMPPPPVFRTRTILQWSESCARLVGTRTSLPTPSPGPPSRSCGNASGQRRPLVHCRVPLPLRIPLDDFLIVHSYLPVSHVLLSSLSHLHVSQSLPLHLNCIQYSMNLTFIFFVGVLLQVKKFKAGNYQKG
jgi:hypothetical protein